MKFHAIIGSLAFAILAAAGPVQAQDCTLKQMASMDMISLDSTRPMVPVTINDAPKLLLLDTGGATTQLSPETVSELKMPLHNTRGQLYDVSGHVSHSYVIVDSFALGRLMATHLRLMVSPENVIHADGVLSSDLLFRYDVEMDFGANKLNYFSPDHCPGKVVYWHAQEIAKVPLLLEGSNRVLVQVKLDGQPFNAVVDTGATRSSLSMPVAKNSFGLEPGSPGVIPAGNVNGDPHLASYTHTFSTLTFEGITVANPRLLLVPDRMRGTAPQTGSHIAGNPNVHLPEMILGMDIMQHLHMYMAFNESKLYVSAAAPPPDLKADADADAGQSRRLSELDKILALSPANATLLNDRCYQRGLEKVKLDDALMDCEASLKVRRRDPYVLDSKGFVLYQLGRYQDALNAYDDVLKIEPRLAPSLFMRGHAKQKLGDSAGGAADIAAAKAIDPDILSVFKGAIFAN
jgi:hypothetical protein